MHSQVNLQGTRTGRISSKTGAKSNRPQSGDETGEMPEIVGMHLGPRTKFTHPYSYDPLLVYATGKKPTSSLYSDRLSLWYAEDVLRDKMKTHFGETGDYYDRRSPKAIQAFLRDLLQQPELVLTRIEEHCNWSSGYPVWHFAFSTPEKPES